MQGTPFVAEDSIKPSIFTHASFCCGGMDAFSLAVRREGGETVLAVDHKSSQIKVAKSLHGKLGAKVESVYFNEPIKSVMSSPAMLEKVFGVTLWTFTPDCGPFGTARGANA
jgi:site-specific DNA-cytosine methylase